MMTSQKESQATEDNFNRRIEAVRSFNRFFTKQIGVLREGLLESRFSLTEVRVLYELAHRDSPTATELAGELNLDAGYLSRILRGFEERGLISRAPSGIDGRQSHLCLTRKGRKEFASLNTRASDELPRSLFEILLQLRIHARPPISRELLNPLGIDLSCCRSHP